MNPLGLIVLWARQEAASLRYAVSPRHRLFSGPTRRVAKEGSLLISPSPGRDLYSSSIFSAEPSSNPAQAPYVKPADAFILDGRRLID